MTQLFKHMKEIILNELEIEKITKHAEEYVSATMEYINQSTEISGCLERIAFKSKQLEHPKQIARLKKLVTKHAYSLQTHKWNAQYKFREEKSHTLTFINHNTSDRIQSSKSLVSPRSSNFVTDDDINTESKPSYFLQITSIEEDEFRIELLAEKAFDIKRKFFIKEINNPLDGIKARIKIKKKENKAGVDIDMDEKHDELYYMALYENKEAQIPLPSSTTIRLIMPNDKSLLPPDNANYRPDCIDLSTMIIVKDDITRQYHVYWETPQQSFGMVSYKIINMETEQQEQIQLLPYSVSYPSTTVSFEVVTINKVDEHEYESQRSRPITLDSIESV
eukprot:397717_1